MAPDVLFGYPLWRACYWHDQAYRKGYVKGYGEVWTRTDADNIFYELLRRRSNIVIAYIFWLGVNLFGESAWEKHTRDRAEFLVNKESSEKVQSSLDRLEEKKQDVLE